MPHTAHRREALAAFGAATLGLVAIFAGEAIGMNTANKTLRGELASIGASRAAMAPAIASQEGNWPCFT